MQCVLLTNAQEEQCSAEETSEIESEFERQSFINEARQLSKGVSILNRIEPTLTGGSQPVPRLETRRRKPASFFFFRSIKMHQG